METESFKERQDLTGSEMHQLRERLSKLGQELE